jgi:hypothetical protein
MTQGFVIVNKLQEKSPKTASEPTELAALRPNQTAVDV